MDKRYNFIESGIVLGITSRANLQKIKFLPKDFSIHSSTISFITDYFDTYHEAPPIALLKDKFTDIDDDANGTNLDYCLQEFKQQVLYRQLVSILQSNKLLIHEEPEQAINNLRLALDNIGLDYDNDITVYDTGDLHRLEEYKARKELRARKLGILGIITPFRTINHSGVGWLPGDVISIFARPTVGKSWLAAKTAAVAIHAGHRTLFITPEMTVKTASLRMDVMLGALEGYKFSHTALKKGDRIDEQQYAEFLKKTSSRKLMLCDSSGEAGMSLASVTRQLRKYKPDFVVIDGIELLSTDANAVWEKMMALFYGIKNLCVSQKIAAFISTQASRDASDMFSPPKAHNVAYGDALIRASDVAMSMCLMRDDKNKHFVQFQKYRDGELPIKYLVLDWNVDTGNIEESKDGFRAEVEANSTAVRNTGSSRQS